MAKVSAFPKWLRGVGVSAFALLFATAGGAFPQSARAEMLIGVAAPLSGQFAPLGEELVDGVTQAVSDLNSAGGINGEKLRVVSVDDKCDAKEAVAVANRLVGRGIKLMVGHLCTSATLAASQVYAQNKVVLIAPATTGTRLTDDRAGPGVFRLARRDDEQPGVLAAYLAKTYSGKRMALIGDGSPYARSLTEPVMTILKAAGETVAYDDTYRAGENSYRDVVAKLKSEAIDVVFAAGQVDDIGLIRRQMAQARLTIPLVSGDSLMSSDYGARAGTAAEGTVIAYPPAWREATEAQPVVNRLESAGRTADGYALPAYAAVQIYANAVNKASEGANSADFDAVVETLANGQFSTVIGAVRFDAKGDNQQPGFVMWPFENGRFRMP